MRVNTLDASGATLSNILVIVRQIDGSDPHRIEFLTDKDGHTPVFDLSPGLYQFIATNPYGIWKDTVVERFVDISTEEISIRIMPKGNIDTLETSSERVVHAQLVLDEQTKAPAVGVRVLVRDAAAKNERWLSTDAAGMVGIGLVDGPTFLVVPLGREVLTFVFLDDCKSPYQRSYIPYGVKCVSIGDSPAQVEIPLSDGRVARVPLSNK